MCSALLLDGLFTPLWEAGCPLPSVGWSHSLFGTETPLSNTPQVPWCAHSRFFLIQWCLMGGTVRGTDKHPLGHRTVQAEPWGDASPRYGSSAVQ